MSFSEPGVSCCLSRGPEAGLHGSLEWILLESFHLPFPPSLPLKEGIREGREGGRSEEREGELVSTQELRSVAVLNTLPKVPPEAIGRLM